MAQPVGIRECARQLGVEHPYLIRMRDQGRIPVEAGGKLDPDKVRAALAQNRDPRRESKIASRTPAAALHRPATPPTPHAGTLAYFQTKIAEIKLANDALDLQERTGKLIDAEQVKAAQGERAAAERDALLNWPARVAPDLAARLGVAERDMFVALDGAVRAFLEERSRQPLEPKVA